MAREFQADLSPLASGRAEIAKKKCENDGIWATAATACVRLRAEHKHHVWTWDVIHDRTSTGRLLKWLAITDEYTRERLALEVDRSITADRVLDVLTNLFLTSGVSRHIRSDNGPEFIAQAIGDHCEQAGLEMLYLELGAPWENGLAESFFSRLRDALLNMEEFMNLSEARWFARRRQQEQNEQRPHSRLGYQTPSEFASQCAASATVATLPPLQQHPAKTLTQPILS